MSHQIDHILIHPHGVFVIETKNYYGEIISDTHDSFWLKVVKGKKERIPNPLEQNKTHMYVVKKILKNKYDVIPAVVFGELPPLMEVWASCSMTLTNQA